MGAIDLIGTLLGIGGKIIDRLFPDPEQKAKAQLELLKLQQQGELAALSSDLQIALAQAQTNAFEAQNPSIFVAGWRPAIGWVGAAAIAYCYLVYPTANAVLAAFKPGASLPAIDLGQLWPLIFGMLGIGGFRTFEKVKGVSR
jgi:hypothetical protein